MSVSPRDLSLINSQVTLSPDATVEHESASTIASYLLQAANQGSMVPAWWSPQRDMALRRLINSTGSGMLSVAVYTAVSKLLSIPYSVIPRDHTNESHVRQAEEIDFVIKNVSEMGKGIDMTFEMFMIDVLTQDNGGFMEVVSPGPKSSPQSGPIFGVKHLDSQHVTRTGDPIHPIVYMSNKGHRIKYHFTRCILHSQMPSSDRDMYGVGTSALSRALDFIRTIVDLTYYRQERFGSRPASRLLVGKGLQAKDISAAFRAAEVQSDVDGIRRAGKNIAIGSSRTDIDIQSIPLTTASEFDERITTDLAVTGIALAFGLDPQELVGNGAGTSQAEATLAQARVRGRLPKQFVELIEREFNFKVLPRHLKISFDFLDEEMEQKEAIISDIRARRRERNIASGVTTTGIELHMMLQDGDISEEIFEMSRLHDGQLPSGAPVESLFFSKDPYYTGPDGVLTVPNPDDLLVPGDKEHGDIVGILDDLRLRCYKKASMSRSKTNQDKVARALAAITHVEQLYIGIDPGDDDGDSSDARVGRYHPRTSRLRGQTTDSQNPR